MLILCFLTPYPSLLHSSTPPLLTSFPLHFIVSLFCALPSLFHHFLASILHSPTPSTLASFPGLSCFFFFWFAFSMTYGRRRAAKLRFHCYTDCKRKNKEQGRPGNEATTPFTPPTFIHSLSTSPPALLDNEVTAVSTIWRAQPDNKTVSDRR